MTNELIGDLPEVLKFMEHGKYKSITINYLKGGVKEIKLWSMDSTKCKTITFDTRWDDEK